MRLVISAELFITELEFKYLCMLVENLYKSSKNESATSKNSQQKKLDFYTNKRSTFFSLFISHFFDFIKINSAKIFDMGVNECILVWPASFNQMIQDSLKMKPSHIEKRLKEILEEISIYQEDYYDILNSTSRQISQFYLNQAFQVISSIDFNIGGFDSAINYFHNYIVPRINNVQISEEMEYKILNMHYNMLLSYEKDQFEVIKSKEFIYFFEDINHSLYNALIKNNKAASAISAYSSQHFDWEIEEIKQKLYNIINYKEVVSNSNTVPQLFFAEALDEQLLVFLNRLVGEGDGPDHLYIRYEHEFVRRNILSYLQENRKKIFCEVTFDEDGIVTIPNSKYLVVNEINKITKPQKQREFWESLKNKSGESRRIIVFDKEDPISALVNINPNKKWIYNSAMIADNLSKIFHSLLSFDIQQSIDEDVMHAIKKNKFKELIRVDEREIDLSIMEYSLELSSTHSPFNYRSPISWYEYRKFYRSKKKAVDDKKEQTEQRQIIVNLHFKKEENVIKVKQLSDKSVKYNKPIVYLMLIIRYWQLYGKGIEIEKLLSIVNSYFNAEKILKRRLASNYTNTSDLEALKSALKREDTVKMYPEKIFDFIQNQTIIIKRKNKKDKDRICFRESDYNNPNIIYNVTWEGIDFKNELFEDDYKKELAKKTSLRTT